MEMYVVTYGKLYFQRILGKNVTFATSLKDARFFEEDEVKEANRIATTVFGHVLPLKIEPCLK